MLACKVLIGNFSHHCNLQAAAIRESTGTCLEIG